VYATSARASCTHDARARFTQDDAHIYLHARPDSRRDQGVLDLWSSRSMKTFGSIVTKSICGPRSGPPEKYAGDDAAGRCRSGAHGGPGIPRHRVPRREEGGLLRPKIDVRMFDAIGRPWQGPTVQFDFNLPQRLAIQYVASDGIADPGRDGAPRHLRVARALHGRPGRQLRRGLPALARARQAMVMPITDRTREYGARCRRAAGRRAASSRSTERTRRSAPESRGADQEGPLHAGGGDREETATPSRCAAARRATWVPWDLGAIRDRLVEDERRPCFSDPESTVFQPNVRPSWKGAGGKTPSKKKLRVNEKIRAREVRVNRTGRSAARICPGSGPAHRARGGQDWWRSPPTGPPVCRILDYGKYRYQLNKKAQEAKKKQKIIQVKEVKFRPKDRRARLRVQEKQHHPFPHPREEGEGDGHYSGPPRTCTATSATGSDRSGGRSASSVSSRRAASGGTVPGHDPGAQEMVARPPLRCRCPRRATAKTSPGRRSPRRNAHMPKMKTKRGRPRSAQTVAPAGSREAGPTSAISDQARRPSGSGTWTWRHSSASRTRAGCARCFPTAPLGKTKVPRVKRGTKRTPTDAKMLKLRRGNYTGKKQAVPRRKRRRSRNRSVTPTGAAGRAAGEFPAACGSWAHQRRRPGRTACPTAG